MSEKMGNFSCTAVGTMARKKHNRQQRSMISSQRRNANGNLEISQNSTAGEIQAEEVEEIPETSAAVVEKAEREEKLSVCRSHGGEKSKSLVEVGGGCRKARPPENDRCPICHDHFHIPCRTNCGHWFCASCFLQIWKNIGKFKQCECSVCGSLILNLVPRPSALIHPGEEVTKTLEEVSKYNRQNMVGRLGIIKKAVAPRFTLGNLTIILLVLRALTVLLRVDRILYEAYGFNLFIFGWSGSLIFFAACFFALFVFAIKRWKSIRREFKE